MCRESWQQDGEPSQRVNMNVTPAAGWHRGRGEARRDGEDGAEVAAGPRTPEMTGTNAG